MNIAEAASQSGRPPKTIRDYEGCGLPDAPAREENGDRRYASADARAVARRRLADINRKIAELRSMRHTLADLIERCHGDERPDCPIIDELAGVAVPMHGMEPHR